MFISGRASRLRLVLLGLLAIHTGSAPASAQEVLTTRSIGMGDTLRAAPVGESAPLLNPAGMTLTRGYVVNSEYAYRSSDKGSLINVSVVDSATKQLAAGLYYNYIHAKPSRTLATLGGEGFKLEETLQTHEVGLALAYPLAQLLHLGVTTKYLHVGVDQPEETPEEAFDDGISTVTMDVGAVLKPVESFTLGIVYQNAIPTDSPLYPRLLGMGAAYSLDSHLLVEFDALLDFDRGDKVQASYLGGAELSFAERYAVRAGALYDSFRDATFVTGGLGVNVTKLALDFGLRQMVEGGAETLVAFSARFFVQ